MNLILHRVMPVKNTDGEVSIQLEIEYNKKKFNLIKEYSFPLLLIPLFSLDVPINLSNEDLLNKLRMIIDEYINRNTINKEAKQLCPFCNKIMFNSKGHEYCLNINCIDPNKYREFFYDKLTKIIGEVNEIDFNIFINTITKTCISTDRLEFNIPNIFNSISFDTLMGNETICYNKFTDSIKNMKLSTFFSLCSIPSGYEDAISNLVSYLDNNLKTFNLFYGTSKRLNISFDCANLSEYLNFLVNVNRDNLNYLMNI